jgi:hypothetical protein
MSNDTKGLPAEEWITKAEVDALQEIIELAKDADGFTPDAYPVTREHLRLTEQLHAKLAARLLPDRPASVYGMADSPLDRPFTLRDALTLLDALHRHALKRGRPHEHLIEAVAALRPPLVSEEPVELADFAEAELAKAISEAETALARVEQLRREARELRAATEALRQVDERTAAASHP